MIIYKNCTEVDIEVVYEAFKIGFSDYIIKLEMSKEDFIKRFFGPEGNKLEYSFVALDDKRPIGVILGGIKEYEGINTIRCGTLAIDPEYRGKGVSNKLIELHKEQAVNKGCKQLFLEVIVGNDRAINFYKKIGYTKVYDLNYFTLNDVKLINRSNKLGVETKMVSTEELKIVREKTRDVHINWQNDIDYIEKSEGQVTVAAYLNNNLVGIISANKNTRINFIWVEGKLRHDGIAKELIIKAAEILGNSKVSIALPNNASIEGFATNVGFTRDKISQYEMYSFLK